MKTRAVRAEVGLTVGLVWAPGGLAGAHAAQPQQRKARNTLREPARAHALCGGYICKRVRRTVAQVDPLDGELAAVGRRQLGHLGRIQAACRERDARARSIVAGFRFQAAWLEPARKCAGARAAAAGTGIALRPLQLGERRRVSPAHAPRDRSPRRSATNLKKPTLVPSSVPYTVRWSGITRLQEGREGAIDSKSVSQVPLRISRL